MHLEAHEEHLIRQLRTPLERDDLEQSLQRITEHEVQMWLSIIISFIQDLMCHVILILIVCHATLQQKTAEMNRMKEDFDVMKEKCELFLRQAAGFPSVPTLSSELTVLIQSMSQVYSMSSIYMDK